MPAHKRKPNYNGATTMQELLIAVKVGVRYYPVYKGETEEQAYLRKLE